MSGNKGGNKRGKKGDKSATKKSAPRKSPTVVSEEQKIRLLNYVRDNKEALFGEWSNGRPKRSNIIAWKNVHELAVR